MCFRIALFLLGLHLAAIFVLVLSNILSLHRSSPIEGLTPSQFYNSISTNSFLLILIYCVNSRYVHSIASQLRLTAYVQGFHLSFSLVSFLALPFVSAPY